MEGQGDRIASQPPDSATHERSRRDRPEARPLIVLGLIAAPGPAADLGERLAPDLVEWRVPLVVDGLVAPPAATTELIDAAYQRLLREDWELARRDRALSAAA